MQRSFAVSRLHNPNLKKSENNAVITAKLNLILPEVYYSVEWITLKDSRL
jgi:hypothetical protein